MHRILQDRLGIYHRLGYVQNTVGEVGYMWYRLGMYHRLGYVQNITEQVGYISYTAMYRIPQDRLGIYHDWAMNRIP
jgi:hypothetical protein